MDINKIAKVVELYDFYQKQRDILRNRYEFLKGNEPTSLERVAMIEIATSLRETAVFCNQLEDIFGEEIRLYKEERP